MSTGWDQHAIDARTWTNARTWVRKLPIPNSICRDQEGHVYGVPTVAILNRFSNAGAVEIRWAPVLLNLRRPLAACRFRTCAKLVLSEINAFKQTGSRGIYRLNLDTADFALGTYSMTIYGNAFPAYQGQFKIKIRK